MDRSFWAHPIGACLGWRNHTQLLGQSGKEHDKDVGCQQVNVAHPIVLGDEPVKERTVGYVHGIDSIVTEFFLPKLLVPAMRNPPNSTGMQT